MKPRKRIKPHAPALESHKIAPQKRFPKEPSANRRHFLTVAGAAAAAVAAPSVGLEFEAGGDPALDVPAALRKLKSVAAAHSA